MGTSKTGSAAQSTTIRVTDAQLLQFLVSRPEPLFAVLDAARDIRALDFLNASQDLHQSLYEGPDAEELETIAPYLVQLPATSALLPKLLEASWGRSWGVYLTSSAPFKELRKHLRRFLTTTAPNGRKLYFRFYDPRVLRVYIPTCTNQERSDFFGPVSCFLMEADNPGELLSFPAAQG